MLARHSTPMTMSTCARAKNSRLADLTEIVAERLLFQPASQALLTEEKAAQDLDFKVERKLLNSKNLHKLQSNGGGGNRTLQAACDTSLQKCDKNTTENDISHSFTNSCVSRQNPDFEQKFTVAEHSSDTILHQKCALCVPKNLPDDLKELISKWPSLPENIRESIRLLVKSATR